MTDRQSLVSTGHNLGQSYQQWLGSRDCEAATRATVTPSRSSAHQSRGCSVGWTLRGSNAFILTSGRCRISQDGPNVERIYSGADENETSVTRWTRWNWGSGHETSWLRTVAARLMKIRPARQGYLGSAPRPPASKVGPQGFTMAEGEWRLEDWRLTKAFQTFWKEARRVTARDEGAESTDWLQ